MPTHAPPPEHPEPTGQDDTPPDIGLLVDALIRYMHDTHGALRDSRGKSLDDLELRRAALASVLVRFRRIRLGD
jgi:hypothetical protein